MRGHDVAIDIEWIFIIAFQPGYYRIDDAAIARVCARGWENMGFVMRPNKIGLFDKSPVVMKYGGPVSAERE